MGRHAAPRRTSSPVKRASAVSAGTLVLCLGGFAPGIAAAADPPPVPQPVSDLVQQVSNTTGIPNPIPPSEGATRHHRTSNHTAPTTTTQQPSGHQSLARPATPRVVVPVSVPMMPLASRIAALRNADSPAIASPAVIRPASALQALPAPTPGNDATRILLVAIATLILGGLASGHIKAAQEFVFTH